MMRLYRALILLSLYLLCIGLAMPALVRADCGPGGEPTWRDIKGVAIQRCGTVGFIYTFMVTSDGFMAFHGQDNTPVKGWYEGHDGRTLFVSLVNILRLGDFFALRLKESPTLYIDGPCERIEVMRCGVLTSVGGLGMGIIPFEADIDDAQTKRFVRLIETMQNPIFAWPWSKEHLDATPLPSPMPR